MSGSAEQRAGRSREADRPGTGLRFDDFVEDVQPRLRQALCAAYGPEPGRDATAEALAYAWEHWKRIRLMGNPAGYLFRVAQSASRQRRQPLLPPVDVAVLPDVEPGLPRALAALTDRQRIVVILVHAGEWRVAEVADLLAISESSVRSHLSRALAKLRAAMEVNND